MDYEFENAKEWGGGQDLPAHPLYPGPANGGHSSPVQSRSTVDSWNRYSRQSAGRGNVHASIRSAATRGRGRHENTVRSRHYSRGGGRGGGRVEHRHLRDDLLIDRDSPAREAWRNHRAHNDTFLIRKGAKPGLALLLQQIHADLAVFIPPPAERDLALRIWGTAEAAVDAAKQLLQKWTDSLRSNRSAYDPWEQSSRSDIRTQQPTSERDLQIQESFLQEAPNGSVWTHTGYFKWPNEFDPFEVLGSNLEALDPIRKEQWVYIRYIRERELFEILSEFKDSVINTTEKLLVLLKEVVSRSQMTYEQLIIQAIPKAKLRRQVQLETSSKQTASGETPIGTFALAGDQMNEVEFASYYQRLESRQSVDLASLKRLLSNALEGLKVYRGVIQMRVHFGILSADRYRQPTDNLFKMEEFEAMLDSPHFGSTLAKDLSPKFPTIDSLRNLNKAFTNSDVVLRNAAKPPLLEHKAVFDLLTPQGPVRLEIEFHQSTDKAFVASHPVWFKAPKGGKDGSLKVSQPLQMQFCRLHSAFDWGLEISAESAIDEIMITDSMKKFADRVNLQMPANATKEDGPRLGYQATIRIQKAIHIESRVFNLRASNYAVKLSRVRHAGGMSKDDRQAKVKVCMYQTAWEDCFGSQANLTIGTVSPISEGLKFANMFPDNSGASIENGTEDENFQHLFRTVDEVMNILETCPTQTASSASSSSR